MRWVPRSPDGGVDGEAATARVVEAAAVVLALGGVLLAGADAAGLRGEAVVSGLLSAIPLFIVAQAWRLPLWMHAGAAALPASVLVVAVLAVGDGSGAARGTRYAWAALLVLAVGAWARDARRRWVVLGCIALVSAYHFAWAWMAWSTAGDPSELMTGQIGWHNQFGVLCLAGAVAGISMLVLGRRWVSLGGTLPFALSTCGVFASGSRASLILLVVAATLIAAVGAWASGWSAVRRAGVGVVVAVVVDWLLTGPLVFGSFAGGLDAAVRRGGAESSIAMRFDHWRVAIEMGASYPWVGAGLSTYGLRSACYGRIGYTSNPHNEWLLAWAEGGLIGLIPLLAVLVGAVALVVRTVATLRRTLVAADGTRAAGAVLLTLLVGHAAFDFDWSYPVLCAVAGLAGGVLVAVEVIPRRTSSGRVFGVVLALALLVGTAVACVAIDPLSASPLTPGRFHVPACAR